LAALAFVGLGLVTLSDAQSQGSANLQLAQAQTRAASAPSGPAPRIVSTTPALGASDVDPGLKEITVTFDRDMGPGFSWTGGGPEYPPNREGQKPFWRERRTCVLPVQLEAGKSYRVGINSPSHQNFRSAAGVPAPPSAIYFTTRGAGEELLGKAAKPRIVKLEPRNGAQDVDPNLTELRVTFSVPMQSGFSWTGGGPQFPPGREGKRPHWTEDHKTCVLPVQLQPNWQYRVGLNSPSRQNFKSEAGLPLDPVVYTFKTK
jgi:hypothetical protein